MLIEYSNIQYVVLPFGGPVIEGEFITIKDGRIFPLTPGHQIKGLAAETYAINIFGGEARGTVYFKGELGTTYFDASQDYSALDALYINQACLLTNKRSRGCSARIGRVVCKEEQNEVVLRFWLEELPLLPLLRKKDTTRWEMMT